MKTVLLGFLLLCLVGSAPAASWYVDNAASGANNGTSWANAWTSFSRVVWGANGVKAGDTLYISGGSTSKTYTEKWTVGASGTSGSPITIRVGQDAGHNGTVIFDYNAGGDSGTGAAIHSSRSHIVFDGQVAGESRWQINNLRNHVSRTQATGITGGGVTSTTVRWMTFSNINNAVVFNSGATNNVIHNNRMLQVRGDAAITVFAPSATARFDANAVYSNRIEVAFNTVTAPGGSGAYAGADGIQTGHGATIYNNSFYVYWNTNIYTSSQHPDMVQLTGNYAKIHGNEFVNVGDSCIDYDAWSNVAPNDVWIYNNVFRIDTQVDSFPEFIRVYKTMSGGITSFSNWKIFNNLFANNTVRTPVAFLNYGGGSPPVSGMEIKNNIWYNCANGVGHHFWLIAASTGFTGSDWDIDGNIYYNANPTQYVTMDGSQISIATWIATNEPNGAFGLPFFVNAAENNFRLSGADTVARGKGLDLSAYFTTDKDGNTRTTWDIGPYAYPSGSVVTPAPTLNLALSSPAITAGQLATLTWSSTGATTVSITSLGGVALSGSSVVFPSATTTYTATAVGPGGTTTRSVTLSVSPALPPAAGTGVWLEAETGTLSAPFTAANGAVFQTTETTLAAGGRLALRFTVTEPGDYALILRVDAPHEGANSLFFNLNGEPADPFMVWDIPVTAGFQDRVGAWRGGGSFDRAEFFPKYFPLPAGEHELVIRGREANTRIDKLMISKRPVPIRGAGLE